MDSVPFVPNPLHYHNFKTINMPEMSLPKWPEMNQHDRHLLLGELIDAMIYSGHAVVILKDCVEGFRAAGYIKSIILPDNQTLENGI
jgi:hypothetical protein